MDEGEDPVEKEMAATPVFLPGNPWGRGALTGYSRCGEESADLVTK